MDAGCAMASLIWMTSIGKIVFSFWIDNRDRKPSLAPFAFPAWCGKIKIERCSVSHEIYVAPYQHPAVFCERLGWCTGIHNHCGTAGTHLDFLERPCQRPVYCHFGHEYGYLLYSSLIPYDYYSSLSSFATVDLAESHIFGWFLTENLLRINIPRLVDTSILLNSDCSFLTWKYPGVQWFCFYSVSSRGSISKFCGSFALSGQKSTLHPENLPDSACRHWTGTIPAI